VTKKKRHRKKSKPYFVPKTVYGCAVDYSIFVVLGVKK